MSADRFNGEASPPYAATSDGAAMSRYRQCELSAANTRLVCWLDEQPKLRVGAVVTLKEIPETKWTVQWISEMVADQHQRRTWRVGGVYDR
jgi:hypothetical protein